VGLLCYLISVSYCLERAFVSCRLCMYIASLPSNPVYATSMLILLVSTLGICYVTVLCWATDCSACINVFFFYKIASVPVHLDMNQAAEQIFIVELTRVNGIVDRLERTSSD